MLSSGITIQDIQNRRVNSVRVNLSLAHSTVGSMIATLYSPNDAAVVALFEARDGDIITFSAISTIAISGSLPPILAGVSVSGVCSPNGPTIRLQGTGVVGDGLKLSSRNTLTGLHILGFVGRQIVISSGGNNHLNCVKATTP